VTLAAYVVIFGVVAMIAAIVAWAVGPDDEHRDAWERNHRNHAGDSWR
jgi:hypothetical protein